MTRVRYEDRWIELEHGESVLDAFLRVGESVAYSCRAGSCQSCRMRATSGTVPAAAQVGLKETEQAQGYFLACSCRPDADLEIATDDAARPVPASVREHESIGDGVVRLRLGVDGPFDYSAGQFVSLIREDGLSRAYSLASVPEEGLLELHVRRVPEGRMSGWIHDQLGVGAPLSVCGPYGSCFYVAGRPQQPLVLAGVGTGLAPLLGIARDAIARGHTGPIDLFHGALVASRLYHIDVMRELEATHAPLRYHACALHETADDPQGIHIGPIRDIVLTTVAATLSQSRVFLCGDPDFVHDLKKRCFLAGASMSEIHADPFTPTASAAG